jgi:SAM-dependent methyltransferase
MSFEFHPRRAWRTLWSPLLQPTHSPAGEPQPCSDLKQAYVAYVEQAKASMPHDEAMAWAIGAGFDEVGRVQAGILRHYGLEPNHYLIDVGCGSGRLAKPMAGYLKGRYLGFDLVPDLVEHARKVAARPDWRFEVIDHIGIPEEDGQADVVCFFSVLTHLRHEQSYWYLEEAKRVLKPGGRIVFSFLEFAEAGHMAVFWATLRETKARIAAPMNVFMDRGGIHRFADALGLRFADIKFGSEQIVPEGVLGQSVCMMEKPA